MKRTLLLSSAVIALSLGLAPAMAQQDRTDTKMKRDPAATEQHDRNAGKQAQGATKDATAAKTTGQAADDKAKAADTDKAKSDADKAKAPQKGAATDKSAAQPKQAQDQTKDQGKDAAKKPADNASADKANTAAPSKNAGQTNAPAAQKSTQSTDTNRNAPANAAAPGTNRNAQTNDPNRNAATNNNTASPNTRISASLDPQKKTSVTTAFEKVNVKPVTNVNFSVSVGTVVPSHIEIHPVPSTIVEIVPQYRGYDFFVVRDEVVIVEPRTHKIVDVIERGPSRSRAETTTVHKPQLSSHQREIIRRHASSHRKTTTGSSRTTTEITVGERLPDSVEIETFPEEVYREVPAVREYRYIERGDDTYLVDPSTRTVIEEVR